MKNFKEIADKCLRGELSGVFITADGGCIKSERLRFNGSKYTFDKWFHVYNEIGRSLDGKYNYDINEFIPNMKENELTIEIPEGKTVDWEASQKQNKIVLKNEQLTYEDICDKLYENNPTFERQFKCLLAKNQLATVAAYLNDGWQPSKTDFGYFICICGGPFKINSRNNYKFNNNVIFKSRELAEKAIKILGGETVKLALEPLGI